MLAFKETTVTKPQIIAQLKAHAKADDVAMLPCPVCGAACEVDKVWEGGPPDKICEYYRCSGRCWAEPVAGSLEEWNTRLSQPVMDAGAAQKIKEICELEYDGEGLSALERFNYIHAFNRNDIRKKILAALSTPPAQQPESNAGNVVPDDCVCVLKDVQFADNEFGVLDGWRGGKLSDAIHNIKIYLTAASRKPRKTAAQVRREALEEAAKELENDFYISNSKDAAKAIRALIEKETP